MYLVYSVLALAEIAVLLASAAGVGFLVVRGIVRACRAPEPGRTQVKPESAHRLKRAGQSG
jgi:hypothetical protein